MIKKLMNISNLNVLSISELKEIKGSNGDVVTVEEYCQTLHELGQSDYADENWTREEWKSFDNAWRANCM